MGYVDLHSKPFEESTVSKLEIFEDYAKAWLPVFVMQGFSQIHIFDFFAGTGYDKNKIPGSPIRILNTIKQQVGNIFKKEVEIFLHLNEIDQEKFIQLKKACLKFFKRNKAVQRAIQIKFYNEDFENLFVDLLPLIKKYPSLVYLDQNGIKYLSDDYFLKLEQCSQTDFLYFVSSSYFWRFGDHEAFQTHFKIDIEKAKEDPYEYIHRNVLTSLRNRLPSNSDLKLYPFSLRKGANIHGIIFGASHPLAVDKFLRIAWKRNKLNGEANFDINNDKPDDQLSLSLYQKKLTKIEAFQKEVKSKILNEEIRDNFELYEFSIDRGHLGSHAADCLRKLKKEGLLDYKSKSPLVTYENVYKKKKKIKYEIQ